MCCTHVYRVGHGAIALVLMGHLIACGGGGTSTDQTSAPATTDTFTPVSLGSARNFGTDISAIPANIDQLQVGEDEWWRNPTIGTSVWHQAAYKADGSYEDWYSRQRGLLVAGGFHRPCMKLGYALSGGPNGQPTTSVGEIACPSSKVVSKSPFPLSVGGESIPELSAAGHVVGSAPSGRFQSVTFEKQYLHFLDYPNLLAAPRNYVARTEFTDAYFARRQDIAATIPYSNDRLIFASPASAQNIDTGFERILPLRGTIVENRINVRAGREFVLASLGDSYASGEGNAQCGVLGPDKINDSTWRAFVRAGVKVYRGDIAGAGLDVLGGVVGEIDAVECMKSETLMAAPAWYENKLDHMTYRNPSFTALSLMEDANLDRRFQYFSFAQSGARSIDLRDDSIGGNQIARLLFAVGDRRIDALVLSIGGNDLGFGDVLASGIRPTVAFMGDGGILKASQTEFDAYINNKLAALSTSLVEVKRQIETRLNVGNIYLVEYPVALFSAEGSTVLSPSDSAGCDAFRAVGHPSPVKSQIDQIEAERIREAGNRLNSALHSFAQSAGWQYVSGITDAFEGHGYCSSQSYFVHFNYSCRCQGDSRGTMHPNAVGVLEIGRRIFDAVKPQLN